MKFCDCGNRLTIISTPTSLKFKCIKCFKSYDPTDEDSLVVYEENTASDEYSIYDTFISNIAKDKVNPRIAVDCPKCNRNIVSYVRLGENMRIIYGCECGNVWMS